MQQGAADNPVLMKGNQGQNDVVVQVFHQVFHDLGVRHLFFQFHSLFRGQALEIGQEGLLVIFQQRTHGDGGAILQIDFLGEIFDQNVCKVTHSGLPGFAGMNQ